MNVLYKKLHPSWQTNMEITRTYTFTHLNWLLLRRHAYHKTHADDSFCKQLQTGDLVADTEGLLVSHEGTSP
jgi:hypothetical protein